MKIQISHTKTVEWTPPWEKTTSEVSDVVGIELESCHPEGCPAVRLRRRREGIAVVAVGFLKPPESALPNTWDQLGVQVKWPIPSALRADFAAVALNSADALTRQTAAAPFLESIQDCPEGVVVSKDGQRSVFRKMPDESSVLQAGLPEYQALWLTRLFGGRRRPAIISAQTSVCATLAALTAQPAFCEEGDEIAIFVTSSNIYIAGFRQGIPLLYRECPGIAGTFAMREAVKSAFGIDDATVETVFANNGIIDTRPALEPLLSPVIAQVEISLDYLRNRLGSSFKRIFLMGDAAGCNALKKVIGDRITLPIHMPSAFDGLILPAKSSSWKDRYCVGEAPQMFLAALGAALAVMKEAK